MIKIAAIPETQMLVRGHYPGYIRPQLGEDTTKSTGRTMLEVGVILAAVGLVGWLAVNVLKDEKPKVKQSRDYYKPIRIGSR